MYDLIYLLFVIICLPVYFFKGKIHRGFLSRFGVLPKKLELNNPIWIHAVSVGEAILTKGILDGLKATFPNKKFVISTVTPTGNKIIQSFAAQDDFVTYLPLDFSFIVQKVINRINPSLFIIAETEIWPNLITCLKSKNIPIIVVNARISGRSFKKYLKIKFLLKPILDKISLFCAQTARDGEKLIRLGLTQEKLQVTGNMKFDIKDFKGLNPGSSGLKNKLGLRAEDRIFIAGSTHPGEEEIIIGIYKNLLTEFTDLKLIVAPRHPVRAGEIEKLAIEYGLASSRVSEFAHPHTRTPAHPHTIFILDTIGQLFDFYAIADIVFVGGSLIKKGGHNILEPASLSKPIIFGAHMFNFRDIADLYLENKACVLVHDEVELELAVRDLLANPQKADNLGLKARALILENQGATGRNLELIKHFIKSRTNK
ncbi:MAG: 3-deoxy-D-manno-octulosonic acid transferase [Candidatus Omnitrophota bacterium]